MSEPQEKDAGPARVDPKLLEILVCPLTKTTLQYDAAAQELISRAAGSRLSDPQRRAAHDGRIRAAPRRRPGGK